MGFGDSYQGISKVMIFVKLIPILNYAFWLIYYALKCRPLLKASVNSPTKIILLILLTTFIAKSIP
jgi:hypothetical protein